MRAHFARFFDVSSTTYNWAPLMSLHTDMWCADKYITDSVWQSTNVEIFKDLTFLFNLTLYILWVERTPCKIHQKFLPTLFFTYLRPIMQAFFEASNYF